MWGDKLTYEHSRTLVNTLHDSSRVLNVINDGQSNSVSTIGSSVMDLLITSERLPETTNFIMINHET